MANTSIFAAFERMWQHTVAALGNKADLSHNHDASNIESGTLSSDRLPTVPVANGGTGATTAEEALVNLGITDWFGEGIVIPANSNLNDYRAIGKYYVESIANAGTILNTPTTGENYVLYVLNRTTDSLLTQIAVGHLGGIYTRGTNSSGNWSNWKTALQLEGSAKSLSISKGGTGATSAEDARINLGFTYGADEPSGTPSTGEGSVYLRTGGDAVVEIGTLGIWTYRKWASGIAECWGNYTCADVTCNTAWGELFSSGYYRIDNYPFTFTSLPSLTLGIASTNNYAFLLRHGYGASYSSTKNNAGAVSFNRATANDTADDVVVSIHAIGRWK